MLCSPTHYPSSGKEIKIYIFTKEQGGTLRQSINLRHKFPSHSIINHPQTGIYQSAAGLIILGLIFEICQIPLHHYHRHLCKRFIRRRKKKQKTETMWWIFQLFVRTHPTPSRIALFDEQGNVRCWVPWHDFTPSNVLTHCVNMSDAHPSNTIACQMGWGPGCQRHKGRSQLEVKAQRALKVLHNIFQDVFYLECILSPFSDILELTVNGNP